MSFHRESKWSTSQGSRAINPREEEPCAEIDGRPTNHGFEGKPRQTNKAEGTDKVGKPETVLLPSQRLSSMKIPKRQAPFEKRYRRVTTYLENGVYDKVQQLYESGRSTGLATWSTRLVRLYLMKHYGYGRKEQPEIPRKTTTLRAACSLSRILKGQ